MKRFARRAMRVATPRRTPRRALLAGLFLLLLLLVLNASVFALYRQVRGTIEAELGRHLLSVANAAAAGVPAAELAVLRADPQGAAAARLRGFLQRVLFETGLGDVYVFDTARRHILDATGRFPMGYANPALELHYAAATAALAGVPETSGLYRVGDVYLRTAFAPITTPDGEVCAVLAAEGGTDFFAGLWRLRGQMLVTGACGMALMLALAFFFWRLLRAQALTDRALREAAALAAAGELAAVLAHEIRNPLAIISSRAERVRAKLEKGVPGAEVRSWFEAIPHEVARLNRTLTQYLSLARPGETLRETTQIGAALDAALSFLEHDLERRSITLVRADAAAREMRVGMAASALHQVLLNLLLNARDAMPAGGTLEVAAHPAGRWVVLAVGDTGCGMSAAQQRRAFEMFYTTKPGGSGLGLAVVRSMCALYGCRIELRSRPAEGTRVSLWIPQAAPGAESAPRPAAGIGEV